MHGGFATRIACLGVLLMGGVALPRHNRPARAAGPGADTLVVAYPTTPSSLDPAVAYDGAGPSVLRGLYEGLVRMKSASTSEVEGVLATGWSSNAGKTIWTFHLRHGVRFHDGTPLDAAAVKASLLRTLKMNQAPAFITGQFVSASGITVRDPYTLEFALSAPAPRLLYALASQWGTGIVSPAAVKAHTVKGDFASAWLASHDAGTGPYTIGQVVPGQSVAMVKYPGYWRGWAGPHVGRVIVSYVAEVSTRRSLVEKGDADISNTFTPQDLTAMRGNAQLATDTGFGLQNVTLAPTVAGPFASVAARQALAYAFDYAALPHSLLKGYALASQGPLARAAYGHDGSLPAPRTDLARAKVLFAQAGVKPGTSVTLWYEAGDETQRDVALVALGQLAQLGIAVQIQAHDSATYFNLLFSNQPAAKRPNLWVVTWYPDYNDAVDWLSPLYHSRDSGGDGSANAGLYRNAEVDRLLGQASTTLDAAARQRMLDRIQTILTVEDPAAVPVTEIPNSTVYRRSLRGYFYNPVYTLTYDYYSLSKG